MFEDDDDRSFAGPMFMLQALGPVMVMVAMVSLLFPLLLYVVARWRDHRSPAPDTQLGLKFALHFFRIQSYQLLLFGTAALLYAMLTKMPSQVREHIYRPAFGFIVPAAIVFGVTTAMLGKTNNYGFPSVGRLFNGYNLMVTGIIGFGALLMGFQLLFAKGDSGDGGRIVWSAILVYTTAWVVQGAMFGRAVLDALPPANMPPSDFSPGPHVPEPMQKPLA